MPFAFNASFAFLISSDETRELLVERSDCAGDCIFSGIPPPRCPGSGTFWAEIDWTPRPMPLDRTIAVRTNFPLLMNASLSQYRFSNLRPSVFQKRNGYAIR